jgi:hypothetical protein
MTITNSTLRSSIFTDIKALLTAAALEYYNNSNVSVTGVNIASAYTDETKNLPEVVINTAQVAKDEPSFNRSVLTNNIQVMLDIYTKKKKNQELFQLIYLFLKNEKSEHMFQKI